MDEQDQLIKKIRHTALDLLSRREHSERELTQKLQQKNYPESLIQQILSELVAEGLLSHQRFVESYIHSRRNKGYGPIRIREELKERGIREEDIEHHLNITDNAWFINVRTVWKKRFKGQIPKDYKMRAQQMRFLQYRGFTLKQIDSIFTNQDAVFDSDE